MGWFHAGLVGLALLQGSSAHAVPAKAVSAQAGGVVASCDDYVKVADQVFTGRTGATFSVGSVKDYLGGDTFGPNVLNIGGIDPAVYLQAHCGS